MAETSGFFGSTAGDRKYTSTQFAFALDTITKSASGVVRGFENELALTSNGAGSGLVNTGRAVHDGRWYKNDSSASKVLSAVTINNKRRDRFVIRYDSVTARSAVITVINGVETTGTPSAPTIGANDVLLGYIESYNNAGVYSYTAVDERVYAFDNIISADMIADDAVGTAQIQDDAVTQVELADNSVGTPQLIDDAVTNTELANMAQATIKGRASGAGTGDPTDLTAAQVVSIFNTKFNVYEGSGVTANAIYDTLAPFVPNINDSMPASGAIFSGSTVIIGRFYRVASDQIRICGLIPGSTPTEIFIIDGNGTTSNIYITWYSNV